MAEKQVVEVSTDIAATPDQVWQAMTDKAGALMPGTTVETDWRVGRPITFSGEWQGKPFKDYGEIVAVERGRELAFSHWSRTPERPADYHIVRYRLAPAGEGTHVTLAQTNVGHKPDIDEKTKAEFTRNWTMMLDHLKKAAEGK
jgi:uncharacterized protein YndB with AHSA1/START domain